MLQINEGENQTPQNLRLRVTQLIWVKRLHLYICVRKKIEVVEALRKMEHTLSVIEKQLSHL